MIKRVAIVGGGPAGFYTAQQLLKLASNVNITIFEKRLAPFGLVRYGVAPDHPEVKHAIHKFENIAKSEKVNYFGNVNVGDLSVCDFQKAFDAVVFCTGSTSEKRLNIEGEDSGNVFSGKDFVGWYNGDPTCSTIQPNLSYGDTAVIVGNGNVALDCARLLLSPIKYLEKTDITSYALDKLKSSTIKHVHLLGRRGVLQASFTSKEIRELLSLPNTQFHHDPTMVSEIEKNSLFLKENRPKNRLMTMLLKASRESQHDQKLFDKSWKLQFLSSPSKILTGKEGETIGLEYENNELIPSDDDPLNPLKTKAEGTGEFSTLPCSLLIKCIGYENVPIADSIPFDKKRGIVPNLQGRVIDSICNDGKLNFVDGLYVAGWIKTGPIGVLTSTLFDASETARSIIEDFEKHENISEKKGIESLSVQSHWITFQDWLKIDKEERKRGETLGKEREKITNADEMLQIAKS